MDFSNFNFPKNFQDFQQNISKIINSNTLKDLIKRIRACKTLQDERDLIQKESFEIRTAFKQEKEQYQNVEKLLYIHMLGYNSHFGQIECLKLAASPRFIDKRLAYLGTMLLLDENQETLTLLTNCLKNDLENANVYIAGLALCVLGNIASPAMARDLALEVEKLLKSSNSFVRKKACLAAIRIVRKNPDLKENFVFTIDLLNEKNHGVLLTCTTLLYELCRDDEEITEMVRQKVPQLVKMLRTLVSGGASPEHDVNGICDPFLQVKILKLLRICGTNSNACSEQIGDVLTLVCTTTESSKNAGSAVLYEAVLTILNIQSDPSLRVLAINLLGKFLQNTDNNVKYVALNTLNTASQQQMTDSNSLQRHRSTILDCLADADVTIRKCALELSFQLLNSSNVRILTRELLNYLERAGTDEKASVASKIVDYAGRYRPSKRWEIDTLARVLKLSGRYCDQMVVNEFVKCVTTAEEIQPYIALKMFGMLTDTESHKETKLVVACLWCIGEYGDILVSGTGNLNISGDEEDEKLEKKTPSESEVFQLVCSIIDGPLTTFEIITYGLNCLVKLESRFSTTNLKNQIQNKIIGYKQKFDVEVQQRACEYSELIQLESSTKKQILSRLPILDSALKEQEQKGTGTKAESLVQKSQQPKMQKEVNGMTDVMDLLGGLDIGGSVAATPTSTVKPNAMDLLSDLLGNPSNLSQPPKPRTSDPFQDLLGLAQPAPQQPAQQQSSLELYSANGLNISLATKKESPTVCLIKVTFQSNDKLVSGISFQVAVPKSLKLAMQPASSTQVLPNMPATQLLKIENLTRTAIKLRCKISFTVEGRTINEMVDFDRFDSSLWA